ncbi:hypothetical protein [Bacillus mojavensis]|uniref:hypothetical protein n=1 Tax=Bacillus mojavensis TaxID=72360 RepID=UPI002DBC9965|nr:hypothetical protein [Bacillus mojavensis]MEC1751896.1 hypothetical protein [Bacillus mojavensis]
MYWFFGFLLYLLISTCIFIGVIKDTQSGSWLLLALAAPLIIFGYPYFCSKQLLSKRSRYMH